MAHDDLRTNEAARRADFTPRRNEDFYRFTNGDFDITVLSDGYITVPIDIVHPDGSPEQQAEVLAATGDPDDTLVRYRANIPLLRKGEDLILVDIGAGDKYQPSDGKLPASLNAAGIDLDAITKIVLTHGHPDHMWAMLDEDGRLRFPNATYYVSAGEWDFWMDPDYLTNMPSEIHGFASGAQRDFSAIRDRVVMLKPGDDIVTGVRALDTAGHTPGHISLEVAGGDGLIISADAATNQIVSFRFPKARFGYDAIQDLAIKNRFKLIDRAASDRTKLLGYHWTYPGVGYAEPHEQGFRYVPA